MGGEVLNVKMLKIIIDVNDIQTKELAKKLNMSHKPLNDRLDNKVQFKLDELFTLINILEIRNPEILFSM